MTRQALVLGILGTPLLLVTLALSQDGEALAARGRQLFFDQGCHGCHTIGSLGTPIASDLSRAGRKYREVDLADWLRDPGRQKPTAHMPKITLSEPEVQALAAFLASLH